jgi:hypothetical protein
MTREEVEALQAEVESLNAKRSRLKKEHLKALDDHRKGWREKISHAKKAWADSFKPYANERENEHRAAQAVLVQSLERLRVERESAIKQAEQVFAAGREAAVNACSAAIEESQKKYRTMAKALEHRTKKHLEELHHTCRVSHDELVAKQDLAMEALLENISGIQAKVTEV